MQFPLHFEHAKIHIFFDMYVFSMFFSSILYQKRLLFTSPMNPWSLCHLATPATGRPRLDWRFLDASRLQRSFFAFYPIQHLSFYLIKRENDGKQIGNKSNK